MSYKEMFEQDAKYQEIVGNFKSAKNTIVDAAQKNVVDGTLLTQALQNAVSDLNNNVREYHENKIKELEQQQEQIAQEYQQEVDYTSSEAKSFEVKFQLAEDHELRDIVNNLDSDNKLELDLLRIELRKRGLTELDNRVRGQSIKNSGEYHNDERYQQLTKQLGALYTMGNKAAVIDGEFHMLENLQKNTYKEVKDIVVSNANKPPRKGDQALSDLMKYTNALSDI